MVVNDRIELSLQAYETRVRTTGFTMVGEVGLEPTVHGIKIRCLTNLAIPQWSERQDSNLHTFRLTDLQSGA